MLLKLLTLHRFVSTFCVNTGCNTCSAVASLMLKRVKPRLATQQTRKKLRKSQDWDKFLIFHALDNGYLQISKSDSPFCQATCKQGSAVCLKQRNGHLTVCGIHEHTLQ